MKSVCFFLFLIISFNLYSQQTNWTIRNPIPTNALLRDVMWSGDCFFAVGRHGTIVTSHDGVVWTKQNSGTFNYLYAITQRDKQIFATDERGNLLTSSDGVLWSSKSIYSQEIQDIIWTGSSFVSVHWDLHDPTVVVTSTDGNKTFVVT